MLTPRPQPRLAILMALAACGDGDFAPDASIDDAAVSDAATDSAVLDGAGGDASAFDALFDDGEPGALVVTGGPGLGLPLVDDAYDGGVETMTCADLTVTAGGTVGDTSVLLGVDHTYVGDLVVKVVSPSGTITTLLSRPGLAESADDGTGDKAARSNALAVHPWTFVDSAPTDAEDLGALLANQEVVCRDDGLCDYFPNPGAGPGSGFADFDGEPAAGTWRVCVGDASAPDTGVLDLAALALWLVD